MRRVLIVLGAVGILLGSATSVPAAAPKAGESVWIQSTGSGWQMLRIWRDGSQLRFYHDDGYYPGDGKDCAWGTLKGTKFRGKIQRVAPDPVPLRLTFSRTGNTLRVNGMDNARPVWRKSTVAKFAKRVPAAGSNLGEWCRTFQPLS